jgi:AcrR family transcriptional regulator
MINPSRRRRARPDPADADDTRTRILEAAERLFAERGIEAVSVRAILVEAGVNVALAHYHFGSREGLITELLRMRVGPLMQELIRRLDEVDARGLHATLEDVLRAYFTPIARWITERPSSGRLFAQLHSSPNPEIRALGEQALRGVLYRLADAVAKRMPAHVSPKQLFLRFLLAVGGPSHLASGWERVLQSARRRLGAGAAFDATMLAEEFVAFTAAGLRAVSGATRGNAP